MALIPPRGCLVPPPAARPFLWLKLHVKLSRRTVERFFFSIFDDHFAMPGCYSVTQELDPARILIEPGAERRLTIFFFFSGCISKHPVLVRGFLWHFLRCFPFLDDQITLKPENMYQSNLGQTGFQSNLSMHGDKISVFERSDHLKTLFGNSTPLSSSYQKRCPVALEIRIVMVKLRMHIHTVYLAHFSGGCKLEE